MTIVKAFTAVDFFDGSAGFYGDVTASSTLIRIGDNYGNSNDYYGTYSYDANGNLVGGTVTAIKAYASYALVLDVTGASVPALDVASAVLNADFLTMYSYFLAGNDTITGSSFADRITGQGGQDHIYAGGGSDRAYGGAGADFVYGGGGNDFLYGQSGDDFLHGERGADVLSGKGGADDLFGGKGKDTLLGGAGGDNLSGGGGNDVLKGNKGNDTLTGGGGRDTFFFKKGDGADLVTDFKVGKDVIEIGRGASRMEKLHFEKQGTDVVVSFKNVEITVEDVSIADLQVADNFLF